MYYVEELNGKLNAWVHFGDNFPLQFTMYESDGTTPISLTGQTLKLGIEKNNVVVLEIDGIVSDNEVVFNIDYDTYEPAGIVEGGKYKFDFWSETTRETHLVKSDLEFKAVAHDTED